MADRFVPDVSQVGKQDRVFSVRVAPADAERLREMADRTQLSVGALIRQMVEFALEHAEG